MKKSMTLKQVKASLFNLVNEILKEAQALTKERAGNSAVFRDVLYVTLTDGKEKLYVGQLLFVTGDKEAGDEMHQEMMNYLNFHGKVMGGGEIHTSFFVTSSAIKKEDEKKND